MRFTPSFLEEIRDRIPIADVVGRRVTFDRKKSNPAKGDFWACCPFHGEKTPSFHCENQKGRYHCFGCGASGDHFRFLTELDGLSFPEAVERLADEAGVPMPAIDPQAAKRAEKRASLYDVMELAAQFFRDQLQTVEGAMARAYLRDRGLSGKIQQEFGIGYAPSSRSALKEYLGSKGIEREKIEACGLVVHGPEISVSYDRFRDRIMFPILDARSRCIAFGGRALSPDVPAKYLNSPETELFSKSSVLYNYARARKAAHKTGNLVVVEGYMDVIALAAQQIENVVAPLGTALTDKQFRLAWRVGSQPVLCFDGDDAGFRAAVRATELILPTVSVEKSASYILLPKGLDPDDYVREHGSSAFRNLIANALPLTDFLIERHLSDKDWSGPEGKALVEKELNSDIFQITDKALLSHMKAYVRAHLSARFYNRERPKPQVLAKTHIFPIRRERVILGLCVEYPYLIDEYVDEFLLIDFQTKKFNKFVSELHRLVVELGDLDVSMIYDRISPVFYDVMEQVHGSKNADIQPSLDGNGSIAWSHERGHRLRALFPALAYEPPKPIVQKTMQLMLMQQTLSDMDKAMREDRDDYDLERYLMQLEDYRTLEDSAQHFELELDNEYRALAGKPMLSA